MLKRELGLGGAVVVGLGSILGTGVFVSIGLAAGIAGAAVLVSVTAAALVAGCNGLSSAQLAARNPVSGGTYEFGYIYLSPGLGFTAGWLFLLAKTASAATAALGCSGYVLRVLEVEFGRSHKVGLAVVIVAVLTALVLSGAKRSATAIAAVLAVTLLALLAFVIGGAAELGGLDIGLQGLEAGPMLHGAALMFVAYTGYGRIATLGEDVREPLRTIPKAIIITLLISMVLYISVALVAVAAVGAPALGESAGATGAPLQLAAAALGSPLVAQVVSIGAITAMVSVILGLLLGLSRVVLAMARRRDLPPYFSEVGERAPVRATLLVAAAVLAIALIGDIRLAWSFSALTVLVYYAVTNAAALRMPREDRLFPPAVAWAGLIGCIALAVWIPVEVWLAGAGLILAGFAWRSLSRRL